jgi:hypothetical protein
MEQGVGAIALTHQHPTLQPHTQQKTIRYPNPELKAANGSNQRRQITLATQPATFDRPLHLNC